MLARVTSSMRTPGQKPKLTASVSQWRWLDRTCKLTSHVTLVLVDPGQPGQRSGCSTLAQRKSVDTIGQLTQVRSRRTRRPWTNTGHTGYSMPTIAHWVIFALDLGR